MDFGSTAFWLALLEIIWINILLSGDNAVVIALAARSLPASQQFTAIASGSGAAVVLRIILTMAAAELLLLPWLKLVGAVLLIYIGVTLLLPESHEDGQVKQHGSIWVAIRTILIADLIMSLDNVMAVAAAAHDDLLLLVLGLAISIPLVVFGSTLLLKITDRLPVIVWFGGALLGYVAGEMLVSDPALRDFVTGFSGAMNMSADQLSVAMGAIGAIIVLVLGKVLPISQKYRRHLDA
jgi:YjbE family integral membrane protein